MTNQVLQEFIHFFSETCNHHEQNFQYNSEDCKIVQKTMTDELPGLRFEEIIVQYKGFFIGVHKLYKEMPLDVIFNIPVSIVHSFKLQSINFFFVEQRITYTFPEDFNSGSFFVKELNEYDQITSEIIHRQFFNSRKTQ